jgi:ribonuclease P protein subunit POP4
VGPLITKKTLLYSTFIGLEAEIVNSSQRNLIGVKGTIVDETKNLIVIEKADAAGAGVKEVKLPKNSSTFRITTESGEKVDVDGRSIAFRPHERAKKV